MTTSSNLVLLGMVLRVFMALWHMCMYSDPVPRYKRGPRVFVSLHATAGWCATRTVSDRVTLVATGITTCGWT